MPLITAAAPWIGHAAVRNRGRVIGSIAHGDSAAEWPGVATVHFLGTSGERSMSSPDFFAGPRRTIAAEDEPIVGVTVPIAGPRTAAALQELANRHGDYAIAGVAAQVSLGVSERPNDVRIALVNVDAMSIQARTAEAIAVKGRRALNAAARLAAREPGAPSDAAASTGYRGALDAAFLLAEGIAVDTPVRL